MPIFKCDKCECIDNTALTHYWSRNAPWNKGSKNFGLALCSECETGKWHGKFEKRKATEADKGTLHNDKP